MLSWSYVEFKTQPEKKRKASKDAIGIDSCTKYNQKGKYNIRLNNYLGRLVRDGDKVLTFNESLS